MFNHKRLFKTTARIVFFSLAFQLVAPLAASALTSGPTQPEVASFEPVGTTDMVDLFTGDFVYNIPLLDIEGYPINISYHSGGDMDQEASWVGYGWNINPGVINRHVRGLPDDFNGETIEKRISIKPEKNSKLGSTAILEPFGAGGPPLNLSLAFGGALNFSNYRGISADVNMTLSANVNPLPSASNIQVGAGGSLSLGAGSQSGADVDISGNIGMSFKTSQIINHNATMSAGWSIGTGYNTRYGLKGQSQGLSLGVNMGGRNSTGPSYSRNVPVSLRNYVPVITNSSRMKSFRGQIKVGLEGAWILGAAAVYGQMNRLDYDKVGDRPGYGYFYAQNANVDAIHDFTRDKDGMFNETMDHLPLGNMTYDVYSVSGQGTGGSFRPFRNDFGTVFDPAVSSPESKDFQLNAEAGFPYLFEVGVDGNTSRTNISSGPWDKYQRPFTKKVKGSLYENVFFKQAGELTVTDPDFYASIGNFGPISGSATQNIPLKKPNIDKKRDPRANLISYFTGAEAMKFGVASSQTIANYKVNGFANGPDANIQYIPRVGGARKAHHISEVVQTQTDGRRYVFGIAAMNTQQNEFTFAVDNQANGEGLVLIKPGEDTEGNESGMDNFFTRTSTPAFAHSYLLTAVLSTDYVDVTGNGVSDDDLGSYTKFNYSRKDSSYKWRAPYQIELAQFNEGSKSDNRDNKGNYLEGNREQWMLHSVESKNYVAEFYTSARADGKGANNVGSSYKLDSIKLYNKHERFISPANAVPIKTVFFNYDYTLCPGIPNGGSGGKLTLRKISVRYGNSDKSMQSPYQFEYSNNYPYGFGNKDRWGMYKPNNGVMTNVDFPFVNQSDTNIHKYAGAWALTKVKLPSGGNINIQYEADDYAYVQNKEAMEMFKLAGVGNSENFNSGSQLYIDKDAPNNYFYFKRDIGRENPNITFKNNYLKNDEILYYNISTELTPARASYEGIKGYAEVETIGICGNNSEYGFVKVKPVTPIKGGALLNPATYTAINYGRYYLPHIIFPGSDPDQNSIINIISGLAYSLKELLQFAKNPVKRMVQEKKARNVKLDQSYLRLNSPGLKKKGGGQRVAELRFSDSWSQLSGAGNPNASYGKRYSYTLDIGNGQTISSGVASYEPIVGGDENPFRKPVDYIAQNGSKWPPNDPVGLYQELPLGESLYPGPVVGYSRVMVESLHKDHAKSAQGYDIHEFYTAKEFPIVVQSIPKEELETENLYGFTKQKVVYRVSQGFALRFNDMHGKPKRNEHRVAKPGSNSTELISYTQYNYNRNGSQLNNDVPVLAYDAASQKMKKTTKMLGVESDLTIDTREKTERTRTNTWLANLNVSMAGAFPLPIPLPYWWNGKYENDFSSVVATKVIQQYGILMEVETFQEGALTVLRNEAFDPITGQALITSVNNEYKDHEYSVTYPAYWGYKAMGPSYENVSYEVDFPSLTIENHQAIIPSNSNLPLKVGDELHITYNGGTENNVWVMEKTFQNVDIDNGCKCIGGYYDNAPPYAKAMYPNSQYFPNSSIVDTMPFPFQGQPYYMDGVYINSVNDFRDGVAVYPDCGEMKLVLAPRFKNSFPNNGSISDVKLKVIRSGAKNMLTESIQEYNGMSTPFNDYNHLSDTLDSLISISAKEFSNTNNAIIRKYDSIINPTTYDSLNPFLTGAISVMRLFKEYAYIKNRGYNMPVNRTKGLFSARSLWRWDVKPENCEMVDIYCFKQHEAVANLSCLEMSYDPGSHYGPEVHVWHLQGYLNPLQGAASKYNLFAPSTTDPNWIAARTITKWSPWGFELENKDATGNYTAAQYGYNEQLPTALAQNAKQHQIMFEGFEDYRLLQPKINVLEHFLNPFKSVFETSSLSALFKIFSPNASNGMKLNSTVAHTGNYALETSSSGHTLSFSLTKSNIDQGSPRYLPFSFTYGKKYLISMWYRPKSPVLNTTGYGAPIGNFVAKSNIIEGWQQFEARVAMTSDTNINTYSLALPKDAYIDDIRIMPDDANMKSFVYNPINQKLMATLDENNFASFFEYDQEGNLVRTKKETEKGIMTISESRSANPKTIKPGF